MNILILNGILTTAENGVITRRKSIKDCMIYNFSMGFVKLGHTVTLIASEEFLPTETEEYDIEVVFMKSRFPKIFKPHLIPCPIGLRKYLKANINKFDFVITSEAFAMMTLLANDICKDKLIIWQEMAFHQNLFFKIPARIWYNCIVRLLMGKRLIVARSEPAQKFMNQYTNNVSTEIVDHGINGDLFKPIETSDNSFIVLARLVPGKNISSIIRIFADFLSKTDYADYKLHIIGDGEEYELLKNLIEQLKLQNKAILHGFMTHDKIRDYLPRTKALLINTQKDLNMVTIPESIISGTPIVTNSVPTSASYIRNNKLGIVKDNWDYKDLIAVVEKYDSFHSSCLAVRHELTNIGCAEKMIKINENWINS